MQALLGSVWVILDKFSAISETQFPNLFSGDNNIYHKLRELSVCFVG